MKYHYDLHIHSSLSACADELMTPNNIMNMALLKKLDIIAITDHNTTKQLKTIEELQKSYDFLVIPGMEISTKENFHMVVYFESFKDAYECDALIEEYIIKEKFDEKVFGRQSIYDINDEEIDTYPYLLSAPLSIGFDDIKKVLKRFNHILVLAHVNRNRHTGIEYINEVKPNGVEVTLNDTSDDFIEKHNLRQRIILHNSDAHSITRISEVSKSNEMELESKTIKAFFKYFHG